MASKLTAAQKASITQVQEFTSCSDAQAQKVLRDTGWQTEAAVEHFYSSGMVRRVAPRRPLKPQLRR